GWWPDEGDPLDIASRLTRNRMYWEGPLLDRPNERPYALHRNGYAGMQRYASFLWSGDVYSTWETLRTQIAVGINTGLSGIPYWGTDIGGFVPTPELPQNCTCGGFNLARFAPCFAPTAAPGSSACPGDGIPAIPGQSKSRIMAGLLFLTTVNCTIPRSSRSAGTI